jgi:hypothetical protein
MAAHQATFEAPLPYADWPRKPQWANGTLPKKKIRLHGGHSRDSPRTEAAESPSKAPATDSADAASTASPASPASAPSPNEPRPKLPKLFTIQAPQTDRYWSASTETIPGRVRHGAGALGEEGSNGQPHRSGMAPLGRFGAVQDSPWVVDGWGKPPSSGVQAPRNGDPQAPQPHEYRPRPPHVARPRLMRHHLLSHVFI